MYRLYISREVMVLGWKMLRVIGQNCREEKLPNFFQGM
jgi:hypothetical protein